MGLILFNIFFGDVNSGIKCTFIQFTDNTRLCAALSMLEGRDVTQRDPDTPDWWAHTNLMKLNKAKCKVLCCTSPRHTES